MASKSFNLADAPDSGGKAGCAKLCLCTFALGFVGLLGFAGYYVYQTTIGSKCSSPELDEFGLSNWTNSGSDKIVFSCFPGYYLEGESNVEPSTCVGGIWEPLPPACNSLPIRIDCHVKNQSLTGNITMWQASAEEPTHIYGLINYSNALKPQGHLTEYVLISKKTCNVSHVVPANISELDPGHAEPKGKLVVLPKDEDSEEDNTSQDHVTEHKEKEKLIRVHFHSTDLKAYKKTELFLNIIFVDRKTTATLVSVHQHNLTLVQTNSNSVHSVNASWNWDKESRKIFGGQGYAHLQIN